jgi:hypothetical protein
MGTQTSKLFTGEISLIILSILIVVYIITIGVIVGTSNSQQTNTPTSAPIFTQSPTIAPTQAPSPSSSPSSSPSPSPSPSPESSVHLDFDPDPLPGPPNAPSNFYRLGCTAALSEGLFPFTSFNDTGIFNNGALCDYYKFDTWGFGHNTDQVNCNGNCTSGVSGNCSSEIHPNNPNGPWTDEQCGICATAAKDPNCIWSKTSDSCYTTIMRSPNVTFVPTYYGMDISECYYKEKGSFNDHKLCCDPSVS